LIGPPRFGIIDPRFNPRACSFSAPCVEGDIMRERNGNYECALCGMPLDIPVGAAPLVSIRTSSGSGAMRTLTFQGRTLHACPIRKSRLTPA